MLKIIKAHYNEYLRLHKHLMPDGLFEALRSNERLPQFFINLAREVETIEARGIYLDQIKLKMIVYEMTATFMRLVGRLADEKQMSIAEKTLVINEANKKLKLTDAEAKEIETELIGQKIIMPADGI